MVVGPSCRVGNIRDGPHLVVSPRPASLFISRTHTVYASYTALSRNIMHLLNAIALYNRPLDPSLFP